jgi:hypothetical protein
LSICTAIVAVVGAHPTVPTLHCNILIPNPKLVAVVVGEFGAVIVPIPEAILQVPVPTAGVFPNIGVVGELIQTTVFEDAAAALGKGFIVKITLEAD